MMTCGTSSTDTPWYRHQREAIGRGVGGADFVVTSGTGSGKSLTYIGTIFNHLLANRGAKGVTAVIVYPMNALINSQTNEFDTYKDNYERNTGRDFPITFGQYTPARKRRSGGKRCAKIPRKSSSPTT